MHWYDDLPHVGYSIDGKKVLKPARGDELDKFLKTVDDPSAWYIEIILQLDLQKLIVCSGLQRLTRTHRWTNL